MMVITRLWRLNTSLKLIKFIFWVQTEVSTETPSKTDKILDFFRSYEAQDKHIYCLELIDPLCLVGFKKYSSETWT